MKRINPEYYLISAWIVSILATLGSLYYSEVMKLPPCNLCWYQRSMMYPLVFILLVGLLEKDRRVYKYALIPCLFGIVTAFYQIVYSSGIFPTSLEVCLRGISCVEDYSAIFGFFSIPLQSMTGFSVILYLLRLYYITAKPRT